MNTEEARKLLATVKEGELFEHGILFGRMDPDEPIVWKVLEAVETPEGRRVTFHLYYRDVFVKSLIGLLTGSGRVQWGARA